jgi:hypothetical protein
MLWVAAWVRQLFFLTVRPAAERHVNKSHHNVKENAMKRMILVLLALVVVAASGASLYAGNAVRGNGYYITNGYNNGTYGSTIVVPGAVIINNYVDPFMDDVYRIRAEHSPNRYYTHPRSLLNGPPVPPVTYPYQYLIY